MKLGKRERELRRERSRWHTICLARAIEAGATIPKSEVRTSLTNPRPVATKYRPNWDWNANKARSVANKSRGKVIS